MGIDEPRINNEIVGYKTVRLVYKEHSEQKSENDFNKIVTLSEAKNISKEYGLDLVESNNKVNPVIIRLCDYSKYMWELKKKLKQKNKTNTTLKEIQLTVNISDHDINVKANKAKEFIKNGDKVKVVLTIRGRELTRRDKSKSSFNKFIDLMEDCAVCENNPKDEGNKTYAILKKI